MSTIFSSVCAARSRANLYSAARSASSFSHVASLAHTEKTAMAARSSASGGSDGAMRRFASRGSSP
jgi:hypothetical protein